MKAKSAKKPSRRKWPAEETERRKIDGLSPYARNARLHSKSQINKIVESIKKWGWTNPILIDTRGGIIAGHGRLLAAKQLGLKEVPCIVARGWTKAQKKAYVIADNQLALDASWDSDILTSEIGELQGLNFDISLLGFDNKYLDKLITNGRALNEDQIPDTPKKAKSKLGQLFALGKHRLLCGDGTNADDVKRLMCKSRAELCLTDPPYSVNYDRSQKERGGKKDAHAPYKEADLDPSDILSFMDLVPSNVMVWSYPLDRHFQALSKAYRDHSWELKRELIWAKNVFSFWPGAKYQQKHEPIMVAVRKGKPIGGSVPANATTILEHEKPHAHSDHPTAKPIALWGELMSNHSQTDDVVYDPFLGSGTTLITAEQLDRKCYGIEIEPCFVDVIIQRWENLTGNKAKLLK